MRGTEKLKYFLSGGYFHQEGLIKGSDHRKVMLRFNTQNEIADWISLGNTFGIARSYTDYADESDEWNSVLVNAIAIDPVTKPRDEEGNLVPSVYNNFKNPVGIIEHTNCSTKKTVFSGTLFSTVDIFHLFEFKSIFGLDMTFNDSSAFVPKYYISANDNQAKAIVTRKTGTDRTWDFENTLSYDTYLFDDHSIKLLVGGSWEDHELDTIMARNRDTPDNDTNFRVLDATSRTSIPEVNGLLVPNSLQSVFGRMEYDYLDKYLLTATFRYDGSSRFGSKKKWGFFPSVAGAWKIAEEPFMSDVTFIEGLKLRLGWGRIGNENIPNFKFITLTSDGQNYPFGGVINPGTTFLSSGNAEIHWETQESTNAGLDISAFDGRIEFLGDFFIKKTIDMLLEVPIPSMAGIETPPMSNAGSVENRGVELVLNYRESVANVHSNIGINFTTYQNEVVGLGENDAVIMDAAFNVAGFVTRTEVGHPIGCFYGYKTDGLFQNWDEVNEHAYVDEDGDEQLVQPDAAPGDIRYRDDDHDGEWDKGYIGSPHPDFIVGLNADVTCRGFDLKVGLQGVYGNEIFNGTRWYTDNGTAYSNLDTKMLDRWTGEGTTNDINYPRMNNKDANNRMISDRYIEDGSYLRLKTVQLGYTFDESSLRRFRIKKCRLYIGVENLLTFTRYSGLEPEVGLSEARGDTKNSSLTLGVDRITYPQARTYLVGLNITL
jgi:TonB-linked SusC/RagA family outer membrane protein